MSLCQHNPVALLAELDSGRRVDGVVDTAVIRDKASEQPAVCSIHNGIDSQTCDVALPQTQSVVDVRSRSVVNFYNAFLCKLTLQLFVLPFDPLLVYSLWLSHITQGTKQQSLLTLSGRKCHAAPLFMFVKQSSNQPAEYRGISHCRMLLKSEHGVALSRADVSPVCGAKVLCLNHFHKNSLQSQILTSE